MKYIKNKFEISFIFILFLCKFIIYIPNSDCIFFAEYVILKLNIYVRNINSKIPFKLFVRRKMFNFEILIKIEYYATSSS